MHNMKSSSLRLSLLQLILLLSSPLRGILPVATATSTSSPAHYLLSSSFAGNHRVDGHSSSGRSTGSGGRGRDNSYYGSTTTRHSYSLSTFSPNGDMDQIVRAMRASMLGLPLLVLSTPPHESQSQLEGGNNDDNKNNNRDITSSDDNNNDDLVSSSSSSSSSSQGGIFLCLPQRYLSASPLCIDTGTPHVLQLTSSICLSHTGISADGRSLLDFAAELALEYRFVYGVEIPVQELLMGLADRMMDMTRKAGWRPYGCALLIMCLGDDDDDKMESIPTIYRVDPSGSVVLLNPPPTLIGKGDVTGDADDDKTVLSNDYTTHESATTTIIADRTNVLEKKNKDYVPLQESSLTFLGNWDTILSRDEMVEIQRNFKQRASHKSKKEIQTMLVDIVRQTFADDTSFKDDDATDNIQTSSSDESQKSNHYQPMLLFSFTHNLGLQITRIHER